VLSALRHRAGELGDQAEFSQVHTYAEALDRHREPLSVCAPTTWSSRDSVLRRPGLAVLAARGFVATQEVFARWDEGRGRRRLLMEDFHREPAPPRRPLGGAEPVGGRWNLDHDNREPPPSDGRLAVPEPWWPGEDEIDERVRADLGRWEADGDVAFVGDDGPRLFPVTREEALLRLRDFLDTRLAAFGPHEDAMLTGDCRLTHSLLSPALNLGLLDPLEVLHAAEQRYRDSAAEGDPLRLNSVEGFVRQVMGWRDKPYTAGGAYIDRMSDYCGGCRYDPRARLGEDACPFTAGYWAFLERNREQLAPASGCAARCRAWTGSRGWRRSSSRSGCGAPRSSDRGTSVQFGPASVDHPPVRECGRRCG
jgi:deoxyribodipyrimidine photolyase-like uncharacterized protein